MRTMAKLKWLIASLVMMMSIPVYASYNPYYPNEVPPSAPLLSRSVQRSVSPGDASLGTVLILAESVSNGLSSVEAQDAMAAGYDVEVVTDAEWAAKSTADFATYRSLIAGDATCDYGNYQALEATVGVWGPAVNGNVILVGTDPVYHHSQGGSSVTNGAVLFSAAEAGKTGAYISLSCYYHGTAPFTPVPALSAFGEFTTTGVGCYNDAHKVADHEALAGVTDTTLSNWSCSVHEAFDSFPEDFLPLAIARNAGTAEQQVCFADGSCGIPYIMARGRTLVPVACGDGELHETEQCDDGNVENGDGCNAQCRTEFCGDGTV
ncbi:MAG TPA: myxococcus cysteine-rich repeat containing protein, partial [Patescibacteria group bacterium]|nr:myxococcus cysteine-rich repeat containing protein [Patescibacteria group bacterium]